MRSTGKGVPEASCPEVPLEKHSVALALWQDVELPEGWELLAFPADPASSLRAGGVFSAQKNSWSGKGNCSGVTCQLAKSKTQARLHPGAKGLAGLVTSSQSIPK